MYFCKLVQVTTIKELNKFCAVLALAVVIFLIGIYDLQIRILG